MDPLERLIRRAWELARSAIQDFLGAVGEAIKESSLGWALTIVGTIVCSHLLARRRFFRSRKADALLMTVIMAAVTALVAYLKSRAWAPTLAGFSIATLVFGVYFLWLVRRQEKAGNTPGTDSNSSGTDSNASEKDSPPPGKDSPPPGKDSEAS